MDLKDTYLSVVRNERDKRSSSQDGNRTTAENLVEIHQHLVADDTEFYNINQDGEAYNYLQDKWIESISDLPRIVGESDVNKSRILESMKYRALSDMLMRVIVFNQSKNEAITNSGNLLKKTHSSFYSALSSELIEKIPEEAAKGTFDPNEDRLDDEYRDNSHNNEQSNGSGETKYTESDVRAFIQNGMNSVKKYEIVNEATDILIEECDSVSSSEAHRIMEDAYDEFVSNKDSLVEGVVDLFGMDEYEEMESREEWVEGLVTKIRKNRFGEKLHNFSKSKPGAMIIFGSVLTIILVSAGYGAYATSLAVAFLELVIPGSEVAAEFLSENL